MKNSYFVPKRVLNHSYVDLCAALRVCANLNPNCSYGDGLG